MGRYLFRHDGPRFGEIGEGAKAYFSTHPMDFFIHHQFHVFVADLFFGHACKPPTQQLSVTSLKVRVGRARKVRNAFDGPEQSCGLHSRLSKFVQKKHHELGLSKELK